MCPADTGHEHSSLQSENAAACMTAPFAETLPPEPAATPCPRTWPLGSHARDGPGKTRGRNWTDTLSEQVCHPPRPGLRAWELLHEVLCAPSLQAAVPAGPSSRRCTVCAGPDDRRCAARTPRPPAAEGMTITEAPLHPNPPALSEPYCLRTPAHGRPEPVSRPPVQRLGTAGDRREYARLPEDAGLG